jgi:hypothetical protein
MDVLVDVLIIISLFAVFGYTHSLLASDTVKIKIRNAFGDLIAFYRLLTISLPLHLFTLST